MGKPQNQPFLWVWRIFSNEVVLNIQFDKQCFLSYLKNSEGARFTRKVYNFETINKEYYFNTKSVTYYFICLIFMIGLSVEQLSHGSNFLVIPAIQRWLTT